MISAVNLQETIKILLNDGASVELAREALEALNLDLRPHGAEDAWEAAELYRATKTKGSGLGDRTCMALAIKEGLPAITTDKAWAELEIAGLEVLLAR
jgi:ribonuclease VapC